MNLRIINSRGCFYFNGSLLVGLLIPYATLGGNSVSSFISTIIMATSSTMATF